MRTNMICELIDIIYQALERNESYYASNEKYK